MTALDQLLTHQSGVLSRRQALAGGLTSSAVVRRLRRREWATLHPGVYVEHTGPPTWEQRAWAAVLFSWPAALTGESALRAFEGETRRGAEQPLHVVVERSRHLVAPRGVRLHRVADFGGRVQWNLGPPRVRYEHAVVDLAARAPSDLAAVAHLTDACGGRRTTAARLLEAATERVRLPRRRWICDVLGDVSAGTCSVLEHGYLALVERPHGLPRGTRQASHRHGDVTTYRDVVYEGRGLVVELDGRLVHGSARARDLDMERDLVAAAEGSQTVRLSYGQVFERGCTTAVLLGEVLRRRGWPGQPTTCALCGGS